MKPKIGKRSKFKSQILMSKYIKIGKNTYIVNVSFMLAVYKRPATAGLKIYKAEKVIFTQLSIFDKERNMQAEKNPMKNNESNQICSANTLLLKIWTLSQIKN